MKIKKIKLMATPEIPDIRYIFYAMLCVPLSYFSSLYLLFFVCEFEVQKYHKSKFQTTKYKKMLWRAEKFKAIFTDMFHISFYIFLTEFFSSFRIFSFLRKISNFVASFLL